MALALPLVVGGASTPLFAKGPIVRISIRGADLTAPIEITDFSSLKAVDLNVWVGPGVTLNGEAQTEGFIADWRQGAVKDRPAGLQRCEVRFYANLGAVQPAYGVFYDYDPSSGQGYVYLPGAHDKWFHLNCGTICRGSGYEGNWFHATKAWEKIGLAADPPEDR